MTTSNTTPGIQPEKKEHAMIDCDRCGKHVREHCPACAIGGHFFCSHKHEAVQDEVSMLRGALTDMSRELVHAKEGWEAAQRCWDAAGRRCGEAEEAILGLLACFGIGVTEKLDGPALTERIEAACAVVDVDMVSPALKKALGG